MSSQKIDTKEEISVSYQTGLVPTADPTMINNDGIQSPNHLSRHPELVSGSIFPFSQAVMGVRWMLKRVQHDEHVGRLALNRRKPKSNRQINPLRILRFNQIDFPWAMPAFQLLLSGDGRRHVIKYLKTHQTIDTIFGRMAGRQIVSMLVKPLKQVRRYANVERPIRFAREYIDTWLFRWLHRQYMAAQWTLKQVQGDDWGANGRY